MEARTDREIMIHMNGKVDHFAETLERIVDALERLENVKFEGHEIRLSKLEKFQNQWGGALIAFNIAIVIISLVIAMKK